MAFELIRNKKALPATDAVVKVRRQHLFGSRAGTVTVSGGKPWEIRVVAPAWRMKSEELEETLIRSYREILRLAAEKGCASVALPLLSAGEPGFPRYWDYSVAFPILRDFAAEHEMQIYLIMDRMDPPDDGKLRADLDRFLHKCAREVLKEMRREAIFQQQKALGAAGRKILFRHGSTSGIQSRAMAILRRSIRSLKVSGRLFRSRKRAEGW